jgi:hypothetical protein
LHDGDRVVFLGNTLIEREQKYGYWELMLTMAWPERNVTFRNLGWSGDTVWGESRAGFGTQADGFKALVNQVNAAKPTVIFVGYGNVEAFDGEAGLPKFVEGFNKLLDELEKTNARIVLLGPIPQSVRKSPHETVESYNALIRQYASAVRGLANSRKHQFVDLIIPYQEITLVANNDRTKPLLTEDGTTLESFGYARLFRIGISPQLGIPVANSFDNDPYHFASFEYAVKLPEQIIKKNELFFHRWRPQNETYLFGFRKHEQGKNAEEVFAFDPLIEAEEKKIAELRVRLAAEMKEASDAK